MEIVVNGLVTGSKIALLAVAFQAVYLPTRVFFIGLAGIYSLVPFVTWTVLQGGGGWLVAVVASILAAVGLSLLLEWANHSRLDRRRASSGVHLVSSLGAYIILVQLTALLWGNETKVLSSDLDTVARWGDFQMRSAQVISCGLTVLLLACLAFFLNRSDLGLKLRALADSPTHFALLGHKVARTRMLAFGLAGIFAAASALLNAYDVGFDPHVGLYELLVAVVAVIIGGRDTFAGPVIGALLLGLLREQVAFHLSASWREAVTFFLLAAVLMVRPKGLLGRMVRPEEFA